MRTHGAKVPGFSLIAVLALLAFASAARAENLSNGGVAGEYRVLLGAELVPAAEINAELASGPGTLLVPARNFDILCTAFSLTEGKFKNVNEALVKVLFEGCKTFEHNNHKMTLPCIIPGEHITSLAILLPKLHGGKLYALAESHSGKPLAFFNYEAGKGCPVPLSVENKGSIVAEVEEDSIFNKVKFSEAIQKLFQVTGVGDKLLYGVNEAFLVGEAEASLWTPLAGCKFGVV